MKCTIILRRFAPLFPRSQTIGATARHQAMSMRERLDRLEAAMLEGLRWIREMRRTRGERVHPPIRHEWTDLRSSEKGAAYKPQPDDTWDTINY